MNHGSQKDIIENTRSERGAGGESGPSSIVSSIRGWAGHDGDLDTVKAFEHRLSATARTALARGEESLAVELSWSQTVGSAQVRSQMGRLFKLYQFAGIDSGVAPVGPRPLGQILVDFLPSKRRPWILHAQATSVGCSFVSTKAEYYCWKALLEELQRSTPVSSLRVQLYRGQKEDLFDGDSFLRRLGFSQTEPRFVTRTLKYSLLPQQEELMAQLDKKTRAKVRHRTREQLVVVQNRFDDGFMPFFQEALASAFSRTGGETPHFDFPFYLNMAKRFPERVLVQTMSWAHQPERPLAYSIDIRHSHHVEALSQGSLQDPELRRLHFNYFLFWDKVLWSRDGQSQWLDLGGVTDSGPDDPLSGISSFKRHFTKDEAEVGREFVIALKPSVGALRRWMVRRSL